MVLTLLLLALPSVQIAKIKEMEPLNDPIPTVLYLDNGRSKEFLGVVLRPAKEKADFRKKIAMLWHEFLSNRQRSKKFQDWLEKEHGIRFLKSDCLVVNV